MKAHYYLLSCLALAACDAQGPHVVVYFDQPFPASASDLPGFLPRHRERYPKQLKPAPKLRRHRAWYYLSRPATEDSAT